MAFGHRLPLSWEPCRAATTQKVAPLGSACLGNLGDVSMVLSEQGEGVPLSYSLMKPRTGWDSKQRAPCVPKLPGAAIQAAPQPSPPARL